MTMKKLLITIGIALSLTWSTGAIAAKTGKACMPDTYRELIHLPPESRYVFVVGQEAVQITRAVLRMELITAEHASKVSHYILVVISPYTTFIGTVTKDCQAGKASVIHDNHLNMIFSTAGVTIRKSDWVKAARSQGI